MLSISKKLFNMGEDDMPLMKKYAPTYEVYNPPTAPDARRKRRFHFTFRYSYNAHVFITPPGHPRRTPSLCTTGTPRAASRSAGWPS